MWLPRKDLQRASEVCVRAFAGAPHVEHFFLEGSRRGDAEAFFRMRIRYGLLFGEVYATSPNLEGIAVWLPSERASLTRWRGLRAGGMRLHHRVGADAVARMTRVAMHNEQLRHRTVSGRHFVLSVLAVDPEHQRRGHASALIRPILARLDRADLPCYAETTAAATLPFYARLGFQPGVPSTVPGTDLEVWPLVHSISGGRIAGTRRLMIP